MPATQAGNVKATQQRPDINLLSLSRNFPVETNQMSSHNNDVSVHNVPSHLGAAELSKVFSAAGKFVV